MRRRGMVAWVEEKTDRSGLVLLRAARGRHDSLRQLLGLAGEEYRITPEDLRADDWEILVWNSGFGRCDGVWSDLTALNAADKL